MNYKKISSLIIIFAGLLSSCILSAQNNDSLTIPYYIIDSSPQNAGVYIDGVLTGETPQRVVLKDSSEKKVIIKLKGYLDYSFNISSADNPAVKTVTLIAASNNKGKLNLVQENKTHYFSKPRKILPITLSALVTAVSGMSAYYFKSLAIDNSTQYNFSGDQAALDRKKKYDVLSGVSLGVMEIGFSALLYYLLIDN